MTDVDHRPTGSVPGQFAFERQPPPPDPERVAREERNTERFADGVMFFFRMLGWTAFAQLGIFESAETDGWPSARSWTIYALICFAVSPFFVLGMRRVKRWGERRAETRKAHRATRR